MQAIRSWDMSLLLVGRDHAKIAGSFPSSAEAMAARFHRALLPSRGPQGVSPNVDTSSLTVKMVEKCNLSQICSKWMILAKLTHVTLLPLMSPDSITHCWNSVDSRQREKIESAEPKIILQKQGMTMRPFLHMTAFQLAKATSWGCINITTATL